MMVDYESYITSDNWEQFKKRYYASHEKRCVVCGTCDNVQLHHHTYARLGSEADTDVVPLCKEHHKGVHLLHKKRKQYQSLTLSTQDYILKENPNAEIFLLHNPSDKFPCTDTRSQRVTKLKTVQRSKSTRYQKQSKAAKAARREAHEKARNERCPKCEPGTPCSNHGGVTKAQRKRREEFAEMTSHLGGQPVVSSGYRGSKVGTSS